MGAGLIHGVARGAVDAEVNRENCDYYNANGFDFRCADAANDADLGERFDRVFVGDVIEHVNDAVGLLAFAKRHLRQGRAHPHHDADPFLAALPPARA